MTVATIPDGEKIVGAHLRTHADVPARVVGKTPEDTDTAWIKLTQIDASSGTQSNHEHLVGFLLQLDCYAGEEGGQPEASLVRARARAVLVGMPEETFDAVVVTEASIVGDSRIPDTQIDEPHRERFVLTAVVRMHLK